jgi:hypothetical protein
MAVAPVTVAASIAALSVSGVTLKDMDEIPQKVEARDCPIFYPKPDGFLSDLEVEIDSFGSAAAKKTFRYRLNYVFLHAAIGEGRGLFDVYADMVANIAALIDAIIANDALSGAVDVQLEGVSSVGPVPDPAGSMFHGCIFTLAVEEFIN